MALPLSKYLVVDPRRPRAAAFCDRCGFRYNHKDLNWQFDYRGYNLQNLWILVCPRCDDLPQPQFQPFLIGPDPVPTKDPRPGWYMQQEGVTPAFNIADFINGKEKPLTGSMSVVQGEVSPINQQLGKKPKQLILPD